MKINQRGSVLLVVLLIFTVIVGAFLLYSQKPIYPIPEMAKPEMPEKNDSNNVRVKEISGKITVYPQYKEGQLGIHSLNYTSNNSSIPSDSNGTKNCTIDGANTKSIKLISSDSKKIVYSYNINTASPCVLNVGDTTEISVVFLLSDIKSKTLLGITTPSNAVLYKTVQLATEVVSYVDFETVIK